MIGKVHLIRQGFYTACLFALAIPAHSQQTLWYSGDTTAPSIYTNGNGYQSNPLYVVYQDFIVPASVPGWHISSVFSYNYFPPGPLPTFAQWTINSGMTAGNGGAVVAGGGSSITPGATGRTASSGSLTLTEYKIQIHGLSLNLPPGHYWLSVAPDAPGPDMAPIASQTSGTNCTGTPCGSNGMAFLQNKSFFLQSTFSAAPRTVDFSMGVIGIIAASAVPAVVCSAFSSLPTLPRRGNHGTGR